MDIDRIGPSISQLTPWDSNPGHTAYKTGALPTELGVIDIVDTLEFRVRPTAEAVDCFPALCKSWLSAVSVSFVPCLQTV